MNKVKAPIFFINTITFVMVFLVFIICFFLNACKAKSDKLVVGNLELFKNKLLTNDSLIVKAVENGDTIILLKLLSDQILNAKKVNDTSTLLNAHLQRYKTNEYTIIKYEEMLGDLDTIVNYSNIDTNDSLQNTNICKALVYRGYQYSQAGNYEKAVELQNKYLLHPFHLKMKPAFTSWLYLEIGENYMRLGDYIKGIKYLNEKNIFDKNSNSNPEQIITESSKSAIGITKAFIDLGKIDSAIKTANTALENNNVPLVQKAYLNAVLADAYSANDEIEKAKLYVGIAKSQILSIEDYDRYAVLLSLEADILNKEKKYNASNEKLFEALSKMDSSNNTNRDFAKIFALISNNFLKLNTKDSAIKYANYTLQKLINIAKLTDTSIPQLSQLYAENTFLDVFETKTSYLYQKFIETSDTNYLANAIKCIEFNIIVQQMLLENFSYNQSKFTILKDSRINSELAINYCYELFNTTKNIEWVNKAFLFAEANKSIVLMQQIKQNQLGNSSLQNDSIYIKYKYLSGVAAKAEKNIIDNVISNKSINNDALIFSKDSVDKLLLKAEAAVVLKNPNFKKLKLFDPSNNLIENIKKKLLDKNTTMLNYFKGNDKSYVFIISPKNDIQLHRIDSNINTLIKRYLTYFEESSVINNNPVAYGDAAWGIYKLLCIDKVTEKTNSLIIIPDDIISFIPFDALVNKQIDNKAPLKSLPFLVNEYNIVFGFSANSLLEQINNTNYNIDKIVGFAPIEEFENPNLSNLEYTKKEVGYIANWEKSVQLFTNNNATLNNFTNIAPKASIIHIATHASLLENGISKIEFIDSSLYLEEIYGLKLKSNLVVLSACETGLGKIQSSEGVLSLARGFYYAGANNVITSLWKVNDASTASFFDKFYGSIKNNNFAIALHDTKKNFLKDASNEKSSPYYWAGLQHLGFTPKHQNFYVKYIYLLIGIPLLLFLIIMYLKRKKN